MVRSQNETGNGIKGTLRSEDVTIDMRCFDEGIMKAVH